MLDRRFSLYDVLGVTQSATAADVKTAFRDLAQKHHPDKNRNSPRSTALFLTIYNAYSVLADPVARTAYDNSLRLTSSLDAKSSFSTSRSTAILLLSGESADDALQIVLSHLNFVLWDIEELVRNFRRDSAGITTESTGACVLMMLTFIDRWVLTPAGFPDYFFSARGMAPPDNVGDASSVPYHNLPGGHRPYTGTEDYFYDVRKRADRLLSRAKLVDLLGEIPGTPLRLIDGLLEAHNYCIHYLGWLTRAAAREEGGIPSFHHSNPVFEERRT